MKDYRWEDSGLDFTVVPHSMHNMIEYGGYLYYISLADKTKLYKKHTTTGTESLVETRTYEIRSLWHNRANDKVYFHSCNREDVGADYTVHHVMWYCDLADSDSVTEMGNFDIEHQGSTAEEECDIFKIRDDFYVQAVNLNVQTFLHIYKWDGDVTWSSVANYNTTSGTSAWPMRPSVVVDTDAYFIAQGTTTTSHALMKFDSVTPALTRLTNNTSYTYFTWIRSSMAYDNDDTIYYQVNKNADGTDHLFSYSISGDTATDLGYLRVMYMLDRNTSGTAPNEQEWAFELDRDSSNDSIIYQFKNRRNGPFPYQTVNKASDLAGITNNYLWFDDYTIYELTNIAESAITEPEYNDGVFPIAKFATWLVHPNKAAYWEKGDSIKWYDDSDTLEFFGKITSKDKTEDGIYKFQAAAYSNEWMTRVYEHSFSSDGSEDKYDSAIDNLHSFCYNPDDFFGAPDNFNDEDPGTSGTDISFVDSATLYDGACEIVFSYQSHNRVLRLQDDATAGEDPFIGHTFAQATSGTHEGWICTNDVTDLAVFQLYEQGVGGIIQLKIDASKFQYRDSDGNWQDCGQAAVNDTWYHWKVQWYADNTFDFWINGVQLQDGVSNYQDQTSGCDTFYLQLFADDATHYVYLDAYGECENANYNEGDNVNLWFTTTNYSYELKQPIATISSLGRYLDRQVIYAKPDCRIYSRPYNILPSSGLSWNVETSGGLFWIPISLRDDRAYIKASLNITRVYVRYASGRSNYPATLPSSTELATGIQEAREYKDLRLDATTATALDDQIYTILNVETQYCSLIAAGKGRIDPGSTITFQDTGDMNVSSFTAMVLNFTRDPKADEYKQIILTDNILYPGDFFSKGAKPQQQVEQNAVDIYETRNNYCRIYTSAGDPTVNDDITLGYKAGDVWINTADAGVFILIDNTDGAADWDELAKA